MNEAKSGAGRPWERKFLGFRINRQGQREVAPQSVERFQQKVREIWRSCRSVTSRELRRRVAAVYRRLVGLLPAGRGAARDLWAGRLDSAAYTEMLLAALA